VIRKSIHKKPHQQGKKMKTPLPANRCLCPICQSQKEHPEKTFHRQINLLMSLMNAHQRRLFAAFQAQQLGHGGISRMSQISGLDRKTIRRGLQELRQG
jgi:transcriptional regulator of acetoin/glycerol metabolism